ncbi:ran-binding protein 1 homolog b-like isoform X2 [Durio zibethinus]|uniref:Ran-binding protein 1 homolog b-like isoform X2 n=1 Tax=Durio zibethinus TaxID=66656 RepID=A0A6P6ASG6_DURZI|nr:ran-binding protein 1 homolog b-like isoform X2 [Durio zibethinus]
MASSAKADPEEHNREDEENAPAADDEDTGAQVAPIIKLEEVAVSTGEEDEDPMLDLKAKLYRFDKEGNQWKERGVGNVKLLKHKVSGKVRLVMRQSKTLKICANHFDCKSFMEMVQEVAESRGKKEENKDATVTADLLEKLSVGESKSDGKDQEEKAAASKDKEAVEDKSETEEGTKDEPASKA